VRALEQARNPVRLQCYKVAVPPCRVSAGLLLQGRAVRAVRRLQTVWLVPSAWHAALRSSDDGSL